MENIPGWKVVDVKLQRIFEFEDFADAIEFVNSVADIAEAEDHHPDILINYRKVTLTLWTHSADGLTDKDFLVAKLINQVKV